MGALPTLWVYFFPTLHLLPLLPTLPPPPNTRLLAHCPHLLHGRLDAAFLLHSPVWEDSLPLHCLTQALHLSDPPLFCWQHRLNSIELLLQEVQAGTAFLHLLPPQLPIRTHHTAWPPAPFCNHLPLALTPTAPTTCLPPTSCPSHLLPQPVAFPSFCPPYHYGFWFGWTGGRRISTGAFHPLPHTRDHTTFSPILHTHPHPPLTLPTASYSLTAPMLDEPGLPRMGMDRKDEGHSHTGLVIERL